MNKQTVKDATDFLSAVMDVDAQDLELLADISSNKKQPRIYFKVKTAKPIERYAKRIAKTVGGKKSKYIDKHGTQYSIDFESSKRIALERKWYDSKSIEVTIMQFNRRSNRNH